MNEWNPLQTPWRSWTPRRPSARLKARIFSRSVAQRPGRPIAFGWLAPATVCLLLLLISFNQRNGKLARLAASNQVPMMAITLSNMSFAAYLPGSFVNDQNAVRPGTFEWTNNGHSHSSIAASPQSRTNDSKRKR